MKNYTIKYVKLVSDFADIIIGIVFPEWKLQNNFFKMSFYDLNHLSSCMTFSPCTFKATVKGFLDNSNNRTIFNNILGKYISEV